MTRGLKTELKAVRITPEMSERLSAAAAELSGQRREVVTELNFIREAIEQYIQKVEENRQQQQRTPRLF